MHDNVHAHALIPRKLVSRVDEYVIDPYDCS